MKTESLHSLVIDHHAGELPSEVAELLEAHLTSHPAARAESARILAALQLTRETVLCHPELSRVPARETAVPLITRTRRTMPSWMKAAAVMLLAALTAVGGFFAGRAPFPDDAGTAKITPVSPRKESPWAKYRMSPDPLGNGIRVVRVDIIDKEARP